MCCGVALQPRLSLGAKWEHQILRRKLGFAADGQMGFCLIHVIIKFYLDHVFAYYFCNKNNNIKRGNLNGEQLGSSCNSPEKRWLRPEIK